MQTAEQLGSTLANVTHAAKCGSKSHVALPPFSLMKVKRSVPVFSHTSQAALLSYVCSGDLPQEASYTAYCIKQIDTLFDIFNSSGLCESKCARGHWKRQSSIWLFEIYAVSVQANGCFGREDRTMHPRLGTVDQYVIAFVKWGQLLNWCHSPVYKET